MKPKPEQPAPTPHPSTPAHANGTNGVHRGPMWSGVELPAGVLALHVPERLANAAPPAYEHATAVGAYNFGARFSRPSTNGHHPAAPAPK